MRIGQTNTHTLTQIIVLQCSHVGRESNSKPNTLWKAIHTQKTSLRVRWSLRHQCKCTRLHWVHASPTIREITEKCRTFIDTLFASATVCAQCFFSLVCVCVFGSPYRVSSNSFCCCLIVRFVPKRKQTDNVEREKSGDPMCAYGKVAAINRISKHTHVLTVVVCPSRVCMPLLLSAARNFVVIIFVVLPLNQGLRQEKGEKRREREFTCKFHLFYHSSEISAEYRQ